VHIAKKSPANLPDFAIQTKTCGFSKFERKYRGFMLTTPSRATTGAAQHGHPAQGQYLISSLILNS
jgi:hypothetical protein